jgi:hypothetical protein
LSYRVAMPRQVFSLLIAFHRPQVGTFTLGFQSTQLEGTAGHRLGIYHAEPSSADHNAMILPDLTADESAAQPQPLR